MSREMKFRYVCKDIAGEMFLLFKSLSDLLNEGIDCMGKAVFEGDILKYTHPQKYSNGTNEFMAPVVFRGGAFTIDIMKSTLNITNGDLIHWRETSDFSGSMSFACIGTQETFEVVNNIHQHPTLVP